MTEDKSIRDRINDLVDEEHELRSRIGASPTGGDAERERLGSVEVELDQCWDLLRRRAARREFGEDPSDVQVRPARTVEDYQG